MKSYTAITLLSVIIVIQIIYVTTMYYHNDRCDIKSNNFIEKLPEEFLLFTYTLMASTCVL